MNFPPLHDIWWEMFRLSKWHDVTWNWNDTVFWLQHKYGFDRLQARRVRNIMWNWFREGYSPAAYLKALNRGKYPLRRK